MLCCIFKYVVLSCYLVFCCNIKACHHDPISYKGNCPYGRHAHSKSPYLIHENKVFWICEDAPLSVYIYVDPIRTALGHEVANVLLIVRVGHHVVDNHGIDAVSDEDDHDRDHGATNHGADQAQQDQEDLSLCCEAVL